MKGNMGGRSNDVRSCEDDNVMESHMHGRSNKKGSND